MTVVLNIRGLTVRFGGVLAIDDVDLQVAESEIHGLVGPNGSGKTTLINCVSGFVRPAKGAIEFAGRQVAGTRPYTRARLGIARSFQHPAMFTAMGTRESVLVGAHRLDRLGWHQALRPIGARRLDHELKERSTQIADRLGLVLSADPIASISFGQQRLADLARASVGEPTLLLLDEPASGLTDHELEQLISVIRGLRDRGAAVLVTDHNVAFMSEICDVITVINVGRKIAEGTPDQIRAHPEVVAAYLGAGSGVSEQSAPETTGHPAGHSLLTVRDLTCGYQGAPVLNQLSLDIRKHEVTSVVGPNGAGKTTLMRAISGMLKAQSGRISFDGDDVTGEDGRRLLRRGIAHVPQGRGMFNGLTVQESLELGAYSITEKARRRDRLSEVLELFPILDERRKQLSGSLSGGEQQMLAIGRALMSHPKLLLLDEPTLGLAPVIISRVVDMVHRLRKEGITVLVVEQNTSAAFAMSVWSYVLAGGRVVLHGPTAEVAGTPALTDAFLGAAKSFV